MVTKCLILLLNYSYDYKNEYKKIDTEGKPAKSTKRGRPPKASLGIPKQLNQVYDSTLFISKEKYDDLQTLCKEGSIPSIYHGYFNSSKYS